MDELGTAHSLNDGNTAIAGSRFILPGDCGNLVGFYYEGYDSGEWQI